MEQLVNFNKEHLVEMVLEKDKRIQDLERLVENQRRLRMQDASQFEEKAAKIKEWVTNKLEVLANQNKQLRMQNKKQKETIESLSTKLAAMTSPVTSPRKINSTKSEQVQYNSGPQSPVDTIDVEKSLKTRRPQLKKTFQTISSSSEDENQNLVRIKVEAASYKTENNRLIYLKEKPRATNMSASAQCPARGSLNSREISDSNEVITRRESPVYDSVTLEMINKRNNEDSVSTSTNHNENEKPPPPPPHQSDRWELELYSLADETFSTLMRRQSQDDQSFQQLDSIESNSNSEKDINHWRKSSSSSLKNDLISLVKPSFTTIDGDTVVDSFTRDGNDSDNRSQQDLSLNCTISQIQSNKPSLRLSKLRKESFSSCENIDKPITLGLFDSPLRTRSGKDNILRTQSVRRNPAPEKLYDFITADLVKRGYLLKPGALKNHSRWFVLKNFNLHSYKSESDEASKSSPNMIIKLEPTCSVYPIHRSGDSNFPFMITNLEKFTGSIQLTAETSQTRDEWIRILTVSINMSDIEPTSLTKSNSIHEGIMSITRHGHSKRYCATLISHVIFFLKSSTDPTPMSYLSVKGAKIREITDNYDYDFEEQELLKHKSRFSDCSLAIYPKFSLNPDPVYVTLGSQQDIDRWFYYLSIASGIDQSYGTQFERMLTKLMINNSMNGGNGSIHPPVDTEVSSECLMKRYSVMLYSDKPIAEPLTSLPNETLKAEAIELFKAIQLFTQVPLEPVAIDYHVCLLQNCLSRFLKFPELRNEFYAQLIKQCTYIIHHCNDQKLSSSSSCGSEGYSPENQMSSDSSLSPSSSDCQFVTDVRELEAFAQNRASRIRADSTLSQLNSLRDKHENSTSNSVPPTQSELLQVMQILAVAVSLNLPRGRMRWWLTDYLRRFANTETSIGKYALYTLRAIDRTVTNGTRDNVPSRVEIMSILLRNPFDHSNPHSLPISFSDGSYLAVEADGSTTVDEFMQTMTKHMNIRHSLSSDFYLFSDDPSGTKELHILEPQRKVLDIVGWWELTFKRNNSGRYQNTKAIKLMCKKRLMLKKEDEETQQERLLIVHQINNEIVSQKIPLSDALSLELAAIMSQLSFGDFDKTKDPKLVRCLLGKIKRNFLPDRSSQFEGQAHEDSEAELEAHLINRWQHLSGKSTVDCVRVYLNCIRRLKLSE